MNVLLISQCHKNALKETRRILDQFAERRGERTWQTAITARGLDTLRALLRKSARKNTAVTCHWIRGKDHSELLWIVGNAAAFNAHGAVPTNTTARDVLRRDDENDWHNAEAIRLLAALAALFHDLGKANATFQRKLNEPGPVADPLRHEWVSLRLFEAFVGDDRDDVAWLERLAALPAAADLAWMERRREDRGEHNPRGPFKALPPLARAVGWLIVSHHRLPTSPERSDRQPNPEGLRQLPERVRADWCGARLEPPAGAAKERKAQQKALDGCWSFPHGLPFDSAAWQGRARRFARRILERPALLDTPWLDDPYVMHMARLVLMLADHHYSSLTDEGARLKGDPDYPLFANTRREPDGRRVLNQPLDEHLIGVERHTGRIVHALPRLARQLPRLARHKGFKRRSPDPRFTWQDKAFDLAASLRERAAEHGFFGIDMASTGRGKTLANGRILYALAAPEQGARFTLALGLRTLTLQTGNAYRERLGLGSDDLAVLVGGGPVRELYEHTQRQERAIGGSESADPLLPDHTSVHYEGALDEGPVTEWLAHTRGAAALVEAPIVACTIDHLVPATEGTRGGRQIAPMLRLMTSDLVLDEPDDFDVADLPALVRLVHWAGLLGSRVLLSSATLPPAMVQGLFEAYRSGREAFQRNRGTPGLPLRICCAWFDENGRDAGDHGDADGFMQQHRAWVQRRIAKLAEAVARRRAYLVPLPADDDPTASAAAVIAEQAVALHREHHSPDGSGKRISFGLVRMANIDPLVDVTRQLASLEPPAGYRLHLCCYHARHPLLIRSGIERELDRLLDRRQPERVLHDPGVRTTLDLHPEEDHLFIVLATPIAEVGRDHDYDWAIVEPSSMRSIIQLAGRVRRHRDEPCAAPNICLLQTNLRALREGGDKVAYRWPGFESAHFPLHSHDVADLLTPEQRTVIDARPRIAESPGLRPRESLVDLEHERLAATLLHDPQQRVAPVRYWWTTRAHLSGELQRTTPFRFDPRSRVRHAFLLDEDTGEVRFTRFEPDGAETPVHHLLREQPLVTHPRVSLWGATDYLAAVEQLAEERAMDPEACARRYGIVELPGDQDEWDYHPALGLRRRG